MAGVGTIGSRAGVGTAATEVMGPVVAVAGFGFESLVVVAESVELPSPMEIESMLVV